MKTYQILDMDEEEKEDNLENAIHEIERFVRLNDRERALTAVEYIKKFTGDVIEAKAAPPTVTEQQLERIAEAIEGLARVQGTVSRKK